MKLSCIKQAPSVVTDSSIFEDSVASHLLDSLACYEHGFHEERCHVRKYYSLIYYKRKKYC